MRKIVLALILSLFLAVQVYASPSIQIEVNGTPLKLGEAPFIEEGRTLVPLRGVWESLGATVEWNELERSVNIRDKYTTIHLSLEQKEVKIFHNFDLTGIPEIKVLDVLPRIIEGRVYVPLRLVAEGLGLDVQWDSGNSRVKISNERVMPIETNLSYTKVEVSSLSQELVEWYNDHKGERGFHYLTEGNELYILTTAGEKPTGGYSLEVVAATLVNPHSLYISAQATEPAPGSFNIQVITYPCELIRVEKGSISQVDGDIAILKDNLVR